MRLKFRQKDIRMIYESVVTSANRYYHHKNYARSIACIRCAAFIQYQINYILSDRKLDDIIYNISRDLVGARHLQSLDNHRVIFYDAFGLDNKGLTQQYLDALFSFDDISVIYIHEYYLDKKSSSIRHLLTRSNATIMELGNVPDLEKISKLCEIIELYHPSRIICHISPSKSISLLVALYAFKNIVKYNINLTDHAFWLGSSNLFDYNFEFRPFGASISYYMRGFSNKQLLYCPYYPWREECEFDGFPDKCRGKTIIFSGGNLYKIQGADNLFLNIVREIVEKEDNVVFVFAGWGDTAHFNSFVRKYNLQERFYFIGNRRDIDQVFRHVDIFIGTYPIGGGLMNLLAAINGKPVLLFKDHDAAGEILLVDDKDSFVFETKEELVTEAQRLVNDETYRHRRGAYFQASVMTQKMFRARFKELFLEHRSMELIDDLRIDESYCSSFLNIVNNNNKLSIELPVLKATHRFLHWKILLNILLNINRALRFS